MDEVREGGREDMREAGTGDRTRWRGRTHCGNLRLW